MYLCIYVSNYRYRNASIQTHILPVGAALLPCTCKDHAMESPAERLGGGD